MESFNYRKALKHPYTLYKIHKMNLPFGIPLVKAVTYLIAFAVVMIFRDEIALIDKIAPDGTRLLFYVGVPFLIMWFLTNYKPDGKYMHIFLYEYLVYYIFQKLPKAKYCQDKKVQYTKKINFDTDFKVVNREE
ncbi:conjugal transfer protein [Staphylococcus aureus]|nr:conjugal transfer protein [Staphylococcus aureus]